MRLGNGRWETAKFNERLHMTELGLGNSATDAGLWKLNYEYGELDANGTTITQSKNTGNIARMTTNFAGMAQPFIQSFRYDSLYRLTEAKEAQNDQQTWIQQFNYDRYGNRTDFNQNITGIANGQITQTPQVDPQTNRFTSSNYSYDFNGNIVTDLSDASQVRNFTFNGDNKQAEIKDANGGVIGRYFYDGEGKRVKKITNLETVIFVYDGLGKIVAEYSTKEPPTNPTTSYTATDQLGSPRVITNSQGEVTSRRDFQPFGEDLFPDGANRTAALKYGTSDGIRQKFTTYQRDEKTLLDFAEARMYENRHARFTAVDPLLASGKSANPQTFNRYIYVGNNPLTQVDPTGLQVATATGKVYHNKRTNEVGIFEGKVRKGFTPLTRNIDATNTINGNRFAVNITPNGWTIGGRVGNSEIPAAKNDPVSAPTGNETVRNLAKGISNNPALRAVDRITNPDGITAGLSSSTYWYRFSGYHNEKF